MIFLFVRHDTVSDSSPGGSMLLLNMRNDPRSNIASEAHLIVRTPF